MFNEVFARREEKFAIFVNDPENSNERNILCKCKFTVFLSVVEVDVCSSAVFRTWKHKNMSHRVKTQ